MNEIVVNVDNACANCMAPVKEAYCSKCGQRSDTSRIMLSHLLKSGLTALLELESKLWVTLRALLTNPGKLALEFTAGARVRFVNPIKLFFIAVAVAIAVTAIVPSISEPFSALEEGLLAGDADHAPTEALSTDTDARRALVAFLDVWTFFQIWISFLSIPIFAVFLKLQQWRRGKNFAEIVVFLLYWAAATSFGYVPIVLLGELGVAFLSEVVGGLIFLLAVMLPLVYFIIGSHSFFGRSRTGTFFSAVLSVVFYGVSILIVTLSMTALKYNDIGWW